MAKHKQHQKVQVQGFGKKKQAKKPSAFQIYRTTILICAVIFISAGLVTWKIVQSSNNPQSGITASPEKKTQRTGLPKMIDLGTTSCTPCKMMIPVMEALEAEYSDQLIVEFINTAENPDKASKYGISVIPTQIFYDKKGKELTRHTGYISKEDIFSTFQQYGIAIN
ncbi:MAG: thioredoxin family protein [Caldisericia bacterium]|nr:thioredoxin family protein [Caldisericia bacterium]